MGFLIHQDTKDLPLDLFSKESPLLDLSSDEEPPSNLMYG